MYTFTYGYTLYNAVSLPLTRNRKCSTDTQMWSWASAFPHFEISLVKVGHMLGPNLICWALISYVCAAQVICPLPYPLTRRWCERSMRCAR